MGSRTPPDRLSLMFLGGLVALFFAPALTLRGVLFFGDVPNYALRLAYTGEWLRAGHFPLWNPLLSLGAPHAVDIGTQAFYPPHALLSVLLGRRVYDFAAALHVLLAAVGTFWLARVLGQSRAAALLAAIAFAFGGFTFGHLQHLNILVAIAWIPIVLAATERYLATSDRRALGIAMLAVGLLILGGHPQLVLYGVSAQAAYACFRLVLLGRDGQGGRLAGLVLGLLAIAAVGVALAAVYLFPFAEWMRFVSREEVVTTEYATWYSLPWNRLVGFVAPFWHGGSPARPQEASRLIEWSCYVGLLPLGLAAVALSRPNARVCFLLGATAVALLFANGGGNAIYKLVLTVPFFRSVRAPARFLVLVDLSLALLAGFGLDTLRAGAGRWMARFGALVFSCLAALVLLAAVLGERATPFLPMRADPLRFDQPDTIVLLSSLLGVVALLIAWAGNRATRRSVVALSLIFAAVDLYAFRAQLFFYWAAPAGAFEEPSLNAATIRSGNGAPRFYTQSGKELETVVLEGRDTELYRWLMWESLRTSLPMRFGLQSLTGHLTEPPAHGALLSLLRERDVFDSRAARLAGAFGVRYVIASPTRGVSAPELTLLSRGACNLYRNEVAVPRAHLVPESRVLADADDAFAILKRADFDPRRTVLIEPPGLALAGGPLAVAEVAVVHEEPDRLVLETTASRTAWLVVNDTYAPGWTATIDGQPAPIVRANGLVRAVAVGAGWHRVEFAYAPISFKWGAWISTAALALVGVLVFPRRRRPERVDPIRPQA